MAANSFINEILPYARQVSKDTGVPTSTIIAQVGVETGWGTSYGYKTRKNPGGMRPAGSLTFKSYDTLASGFADYEKYLMYNRYSAARSASSPEAAAEALEAGHWAGGETTYGEKLIAAIKHYDLKQYDSGGSAGTGTTLLQAAGGDSLSSYTADNTTLTGSIMRFSVLVVLVLIIFISLLRVFPAVK